MVCLAAGELKQVVTIQQNRRTFDTNGDPTTSWTDLATRRASIMPTVGTEKDAGGTFAAVVTVKIKMRYFAGLTPAQRIQNDSKNYEILSVVNVESADVVHELICKEIVTGG